MGSVGIITDSVACLDEDVASHLDIEVVPIHVIIDGVDYRDGIDLTPEGAYDLLDRSSNYSSAAPTVAEWHAAFERATERGHDSLVVVPVSRELSSTYDSARLAASDSSVPVTVVDSGAATAAQGLLVRRLAERSLTGWSREELVAVVEKTREKYHFVGAIAELERLAHSGRMPATLAWLGDRADLKPLLELKGDGTVHSRCLIRGFASAIERVIGDVLSLIPADQPVRVVVTQARLDDDADRMAERLRAERPKAEVTEAPFSTVMVANTGPIVGIAWEDRGAWE